MFVIQMLIVVWICKQEWSRDPISSRFVRNTLHTPAPPAEFTPVMLNHVSLQDKFYPMRTSLPILHSVIRSK